MVFRDKSRLDTILSRKKGHNSVKQLIYFFFDYF